jgi:hypothetical protein
MAHEEDSAALAVVATHTPTPLWQCVPSEHWLSAVQNAAQ